MKIGELIKQERIRNGLSQEDVAKAISSTKQAVYKYENGIVTNIPMDKIEVMAQLFSVTPSYLMGWDDEKTNNLHVQGFNLQMFSDPATASPSEALSEGERALLDLFRQLPEESQTMYLEVLRATLKSLAKD